MHLWDFPFAETFVDNSNRFQTIRLANITCRFISEYPTDIIIIIILYERVWYLYNIYIYYICPVIRECTLLFRSFCFITIHEANMNINSTPSLGIQFTTNKISREKYISTVCLLKSLIVFVSEMIRLYRICVLRVWNERYQIVDVYYTFSWSGALWIAFFILALKINELGRASECRDIIFINLQEKINHLKPLLSGRIDLTITKLTKKKENHVLYSNYS